MNPFDAFYEQATVWINALSRDVQALPVSYAFAAGMLATVNPCGFVMLPAFAGFYATAGGASSAAMNSGRRLLRALWMGVLVTVAFVAIFTAAGALVTAGGRVIMEWAGWAGVVVGAALVALGVYQLVTRRAVFASATSGVRVQRSRTTGGVLLFGAGYAVCSLGCTLPAFLVVAGSVFLGDRDFAESLRRFMEYGAGMGLVLTVIAVGVALARDRATRFLRPLLPVVDATANAALVLAGVYVIWYWSTKGPQPL